MTDRSNKTTENRMTKDEQNALLQTREARFMKHMERHQQLTWSEIQEKLLASPEILMTVNEMETSGGEPDVMLFEDGAEIYFVDCAKESPTGRRSVCYDRAALEGRKKHQPRTSAEDLATAIGVEILTEDDYRQLQSLGDFDLKTSTWIKTPEAIRSLGGALFGDKRYNYVFIYHNGADSYYASRGFRGKVRI